MLAHLKYAILDGENQRMGVLDLLYRIAASVAQARSEYGLSQEALSDRGISSLRDKCLKSSQARCEVRVRYCRCDTWKTQC